LLMSSRCGDVLSCCSRFALRNAALMFCGKQASRRPEVGDSSFTVHRNKVMKALNRQLTLTT
jgi:hypothetical protein